MALSCLTETLVLLKDGALRWVVDVEPNHRIPPVDLDECFRNMANIFDLPLAKNIFDPFLKVAKSKPGSPKPYVHALNKIWEAFETAKVQC